MGLGSLLLAALLLPAAPASAKLDAETEKEIPRFVKLDVAAMTPPYIEHMLAVDIDDVPQKYRKRFQAKRLELYTMRQLGEGKRKGTIRTPDQDCAIPTEAKSDDVTMLKMAGFVEIYDVEVLYLIKNTHCTERQMACEFSLQVVHEKLKSGKTRTRYFLSGSDPLMALVSEYRSKGGNHDTPFFGRSPFPQCSG